MCDQARVGRINADHDDAGDDREQDMMGGVLRDGRIFQKICDSFCQSGFGPNPLALDALAMLRAVASPLCVSSSALFRQCNLTAPTVRSRYFPVATAAAELRAGGTRALSTRGPRVSPPSAAAAPDATNITASSAIVRSDEV